MLALFLGAGFSKWSVNLPLASQLFDFNIEPWGRLEPRKIEMVKSLKKNWDNTHKDGLSEQFIADSLNFSQKQKEAILWYICRKLSEPFIWHEFHAQRWRRHVLMIDENRKFKIEGIIKAKRYLHNFLGPLLSGIITTNYDLIVEYSLGTKLFNYGIPDQILIGRGPYPVSQWRNPVILKGKFSLAKIHGSISWDEEGYYTDGRRGITGKALIIAPTQDKPQPESLKSVWELAEKILQRARRLLVFGFAFNPYDKQVLNLLKNYGSKIEKITLIDIKPKVEQAKELWPNSEIISQEPPSF